MSELSVSSCQYSHNRSVDQMAILAESRFYGNNLAFRDGHHSHVRDILKHLSQVDLSGLFCLIGTAWTVAFVINLT